MHEKIEIEQYFFDEATLLHLSLFAAHFDNPCCLCTPSLGQELERRGLKATTLDIDTRFSCLKGFGIYNISEPHPLPATFGVVICDPPFLNVPLSQLFRAISILSGDNYNQPLIVNYLASRASSIISEFAPFGLKPTGYRPGYRTIQNIGRNQMEFFGNIGPQHPLKPPTPSL